MENTRLSIQNALEAKFPKDTFTVQSVKLDYVDIENINTPDYEVMQFLKTIQFSKSVRKLNGRWEAEIMENAERKIINKENITVEQAYEQGLINGRREGLAIARRAIQNQLNIIPEIDATNN